MPEIYNGTETFYAKTRVAWRKWLQKNHKTHTGVCLIMYKKQSGVPSVYYPEAVEEALCFGWIDSKANKRDEDSFYQYFTKRKPKSKWSQVNKLRVEKLMAENLLTEAGLNSIKTAKENGAWDALNDSDNLVIPPDLERAFAKNQIALQNFEKFPNSAKKVILEWITNAKKTETREKRIHDAVMLAAKNLRANQPNR